ncbi:Pectin acetylesterase [Psidium guajava]|nr:Pectin acetylesterase [Psidium guajava]
MRASLYHSGSLSWAKTPNTETLIFSPWSHEYAPPLSYRNLCPKHPPIPNWRLQTIPEPQTLSFAKITAFYRIMAPEVKNPRPPHLFPGLVC